MCCTQSGQCLNAAVEIFADGSRLRLASANRIEERLNVGGVARARIVPHVFPWVRSIHHRTLPADLLQVRD
jgi:hypothetical protein